MVSIYPVSAPQGDFPETQEAILKNDEPAVCSLEQYSALTDDVELALDEADSAAVLSDTHYSSEDVFSRVRQRILYNRRSLQKLI